MLMFGRWKLIANKLIVSADGVTKVNYYWYYDKRTKQNVFMLGEQKPSLDWADWTEETEEGAKKWFDNCNGWILDM